ncbi:hypothetical protein FNV43_RR01855 [Rhamnella rubrinervis]|uniref:Peptidase A1 domain-containing protein n=1 Tax=Rhamnella rubrinervis TaxID=2594499 RepID=A0A8K0HT02_9ROSA|nr:hypothetical protein FNV43_RR01855 [Rhamnella rubrinervis]
MIISIAAETSLKPKAIVLNITKDPSTLQYITQIHQRKPLVPVKLTLDLGGRFLWVDCRSGYDTYKTIRCRTPECSLVQTNTCENDKICFVYPDNPVPDYPLQTSLNLAQDVVSLPALISTTSNSITSVTIPKFLFACGSPYLAQGLASGVEGIAGLGRSRLGLPIQLASTFNLPRKFSLCLASSNNNGGGFVFFGQPPKLDVYKSLTYTPLLVNPVSTSTGHAIEGEKSVDYFIGLKSIKVNNVAVPLNASLLVFDSMGNGGTRLSTAKRYTVLLTPIYNAVVGEFVKAMSELKVPRVAAVGQFGACFNSTYIASTEVGPDVPVIDLVLESVYWRLYGANSMVQVGKDVMCLGFIDEGVVDDGNFTNRATTSIVIGGHQLEDNLLQFDIANNRLGFSSSLLSKSTQTTCSNIHSRLVHA